jgi:hypothetical protein
MVNNLEIITILGHANKSRFGLTVVGDLRLALYLPKTKRFEDGVIFKRLRAKDWDMFWYDEKSPQADDIRAIVKGVKGYHVKYPGNVTLDESYIEMLKQNELYRNDFKQRDKKIIDSYFDEQIEFGKHQIPTIKELNIT